MPIGAAAHLAPAARVRPLAPPPRRSAHSSAQQAPQQAQRHARPRRPGSCGRSRAWAGRCGSAAPAGCRSARCPVAWGGRGEGWRGPHAGESARRSRGRQVAGGPGKRRPGCTHGRVQRESSRRCARRGWHCLPTPACQPHCRLPSPPAAHACTHLQHLAQPAPLVPRPLRRLGPAEGQQVVVVCCGWAGGRQEGWGGLAGAAPTVPTQPNSGAATHGGGPCTVPARRPPHMSPAGCCRAPLC